RRHGRAHGPLLPGNAGAREAVGRRRAAGGTDLPVEGVSLEGTLLLGGVRAAGRVEVNGQPDSAFERLLAVLDSDREKAGERYELLRLRLTRFFEWRRAGAPADLVDRTIERVTRKLAEGEGIREEDPSAYFYGVARNILREHWAENRRE